MDTVKLTGGFTWNGSERRTDRYGGIMLCTKVDHWSDATPSIDLSSVKPFVGKRAKISAKVLESHKSSHVGDLFRGITPSQTKVGTVLELGVGTIKRINVEDGFQSIIFCRDGREEMNDWMDPKVLYRLHDHLVELVIEDAEHILFEPAVTKKEKAKGEKDGCLMSLQPDPDPKSKGGYMQHKDTFSNE